jgi:hypothetical protein
MTTMPVRGSSRVAIAHSTSEALRMSTSSSTTVAILSGGKAAKVASSACFAQPARFCAMLMTAW